MLATRRSFLKTAAAGLTVSFLAPRLIADPFFSSSAPVLVVVQLAGGNDALNTFIPYTDGRYRSLRPSLAIAESELLDLDGRMAMHPSLARMHALYQRGAFTFVNNVGFSSLDRSHFHCQDVWQEASEGFHLNHEVGKLGWLGRVADLYMPDASSLSSVSIGNRVPLAMQAHDGVGIAFSDSESFDLTANPQHPDDAVTYTSRVRAIYGEKRLDVAADVIRTHGEKMFGAIDLVSTLPPSSSSVTYPESQLGEGLDLVARLIAGNVGAQLVWVTTGGYDTHATQATAHANLLSDLSESLGAFYDDLVARGLADRTLVMAWSEFGRRAQENASLGTDHGKAGTVFLLGDRLKGSTYYGNAPDLGSLDDGDLRTEVDYRAVYATIIRDWLGHDPEPVLYGQFENLGFLDSAAAPSRRRSARRGTG